MWGLEFLHRPESAFVVGRRDGRGVDGAGLENRSSTVSEKPLRRNLRARKGK